MGAKSARKGKLKLSMSARQTRRDWIGRRINMDTTAITQGPDCASSRAVQGAIETIGHCNWCERKAAEGCCSPKPVGKDNATASWSACRPLPLFLFGGRFESHPAVDASPGALPTTTFL